MSPWDAPTISSSIWQRSSADLGARVAFRGTALCGRAGGKFPGGREDCGRQAAGGGSHAGDRNVEER
eukprot:4547661-Prymnesium_polylepis.1